MNDPSPRPPSFVRQNLIVLTLLSLFSFGMYTLWWLYHQTRVVNSFRPDVAIPMALVHVAMVAMPLYTVLFLSTYTPGEAPTEPPPAYFVALYLVAVVSTATWTLLVRRGINAASGAKPGDSNWLSLGLTLLLCVVQLAHVYMQYVVNNELDRRGR